MKHWTEKEDAIVKELYLHKTAKQIALILDRPPNSINFRAFKLGLSKTKTYKLSEIKFIVENYKTMKYKDIASKLNKPYKSICQKIFELQHGL